MASNERGATRFHTFSESSPDSMMIVEGSGRFIAMNASARRMLGYSREEIGELYLDSIGAGAIRDSFPEFRKIGRVKAEGSLVSKDGNTLKAVFHTAAMGDGSYQFVLGPSQERESTGQTIFDSAPFPLIELDCGSDGLVVRNLNGQAQSLCGSTGAADCRGRRLSQLLNLRDRDVLGLEEWLRSDRAAAYENTWTIRSGDGPERHLKSRMTRIGRGAEAGDRALLSLCDVTEEVSAKNEIIATLKDGAFLFKESHHRIKNNLSLLASMISLQRGGLSDRICADKLLEAQMRIQAIALFHDHMATAQGGNFTLKIGAFLEDIVRSIESTCLDGNAPIVIDTSIVDPDLELDAKRASSLGLIVNELITNALKHAFASRSSGRVWVKAEKAEGHLKLSIADDGQGLRSGFDWRKDGGLGFKFIDILSKQLSAEVAVKSERGLEFSLGLKL